MYTLSDFDFELPPDLIAQTPAAQRSDSRLLDAMNSQQVIDRVFYQLPQLLRPTDLLVFNDTRVIKARLHGSKDSGGAVELLIERVLPHFEVWAHLRASKSPKLGSRIQLPGHTVAEVLGRAGAKDALFHLRLSADPLWVMAEHGRVPLPPYITHSDTLEDERRYQTVFATHPGAVAAPTAALHFDLPLLDELNRKGIPNARVTLHVGAGTFQPVRCEQLSEHKMHSEWFEVPQSTVDAIERTRAQGGRVVAVGTTTLRALESAASIGVLQACRRETDIFITPGFEFRVVDVLLTNFHLPQSTLLMLVSAFAGFEHVRTLYTHAIASRYRFFSYGDAMLLAREHPS